MRVLALACLSTYLGACTTNPAQPPDTTADAGMGSGSAPMVRQVLASEMGELNGEVGIYLGQLAFGSHAADFFSEDDGIVLRGATQDFQEIRIIVDKALERGSLEEIGCYDGSFSPIPPGTSEQDIANCSDPTGVLSACEKVCLGEDGSAIGILDQDQDGVADDMRMRAYAPDELAVTIVCEGVNIPIDADNSYWQPSGSQDFPIDPTLSYRGIGPAIVLRPQSLFGLRSGSDCQLAFHPEIADTEGRSLCVPAGGLPSAGCPAGENATINFHTEAMALVISVPKDGSPAVALDASEFIVLYFNSYVDAATIGGLTLTADGQTVAIDPSVAPRAEGYEGTQITISLPDDFLPNTTYQLNIPDTVGDLLGGTLEEATTISWTTASL